MIVCSALVLACADPGADVATYAAAIADGGCARVRDADLRDDCWVAQAERTGLNQCAVVLSELMRDECWFQLAEHDDDPAWCSRAGQFADDCRMHHVSRHFRTLGRGSAPTEEQVAAIITAAGLAPADSRPWTAWYREMLSRQPTLDLSVCPPGARREACRNAGLVLYNDRLNRARDQRAWKCGEEPPRSLAVVPDPDLEALRARRTDACTR